jgi:hypothetical protein
MPKQPQEQLSDRDDKKNKNKDQAIVNKRSNRISLFVSFLKEPMVTQPKFIFFVMVCFTWRLLDRIKGIISF